jgi:hypothetical protein
MNPYASQLGSRDPRATIEETVERLRALLEKIGAERIELPGGLRAGILVPLEANAG